MTRFVSGEAEMEENPILKASLSMASDIPLYAQLTGIIKNTITSGTLRVGDLLPSEAELCDKFEISRNTVRQAIGSLEEAGFVVRKRGKGTFVADPSTRRKGVQYSFTTEISSMGKHPSSTLVSFDIIDPAPKIKRLMALEDGVKVYCFTRDTNWVAYEAVQGAVFDHLLSVLPEFGLRSYQRSSDRDQCVETDSKQE